MSSFSSETNKHIFGSIFKHFLDSGRHLKVEFEKADIGIDSLLEYGEH